MSKPLVIDHPLYLLLRTGAINQFNQRWAKGERCDLRNCDFRSIDLRGLNAETLDLSNCYFKLADIRGIDFRNTNLEGASIKDAKVSGTYFPLKISADEIKLSLLYGTRLRYQ